LAILIAEDVTVPFGLETCHAGSVRKRLNKSNKLNSKRRRPFENTPHAPGESAGQQLSLEDQERASLGRIMSEMGHKGGRRAPRNQRFSTVMK